MKRRLALVLGILLTGCAKASPEGSAPGTADVSSPDGSADPSSAESGCSLTADTSPTAAVSASGCAVLARDTSACAASRAAAGLSGPWLLFSCRVELSVADGIVIAHSDGRPDYASFYFPDSDACYATYPTGKRNPNRIATENHAVAIALQPSGAGEPMRTAIVGVAVNGVPIFGNFAAPGDDIFNEAQTFDRCAGHPQEAGQYHYHSEPLAITQDDAAFVGMMRDGHPIYGRRDTDGTLPTLDDDGGHTGVTTDSPQTPVYHYHVNEQTSTGARTAGEKQWFITKGRYHAAPAACSKC